MTDNTPAYFPVGFTHGARLLRQLQTLQPGMTARVDCYTLDDVEVPHSDPFRSLTRVELVEWFRVRLPFVCTTNELPGGDWEFRREPIGDQWRRELLAMDLSRGPHDSISDAVVEIVKGTR